MINTAGIPKGCEAKEADTSPCAKYPIDLPRPQPQQPSNPKSVGTHRVTVFSNVGANTARPTKPAVQSHASRGMLIRNDFMIGLTTNPTAKGYCGNLSKVFVYLYPALYIARPFFVQRQQNNMYAVVEISGQQYAVAPKQTVKVPLMDKNVGDTVEFTNILLASDNGNVSVGAPFIKGSVKATVVEHGKGEKVLVFHKKRRKGYQKLNGHRQLFTSITITDIKI